MSTVLRSWPQKGDAEAERVRQGSRQPPRHEVGQMGRRNSPRGIPSWLMIELVLQPETTRLLIDARHVARASITASWRKAHGTRGDMMGYGGP